MSTVIKYSVVRFRPFADTGEFANVGVISLRIDDGAMSFRLAPRRFPRIRNFFDDVAYKAYDDLIVALEEEFSRLTDFLPHFPNFRGEDAFSELVRAKESSLIFSEPRVVEASEGLERATEHLFLRFVKREMAPQTRETILTKDIRKTLRVAGIKKFHSLRIDDELVPVNFPLAFGYGDLKAIKPIAFSQKNPLTVLDHGAHWRRRFDILLSKGKIRRDSILIAVEPPQNDHGDILVDAYRLAFDEIHRLPFEVVESTDMQASMKIIDFARQAIGSHSLF